MTENGSLKCHKRHKHSNPQRRTRQRKLVRMLRRTEDVGKWRTLKLN